MASIAAGPGRGLVVLTTLGVAAAILVSLARVMWTPLPVDVAVAHNAAGRTHVTWIAPDGPSWSADVRPGDRVMQARSRGRVVVRQAGRRLVLGAHALPATPVDVLVVGLGLCLLALGAVVVTKSPDRVAGRAYWRMSLCAGAALGTVPAGLHGLWWALVLNFVALRLFGPTVLELAWAFPREERRPRRLAPLRRLAIWSPALALLAVYPLCWWRPAPLFDLVQLADGVVLLGYIAAAGVRLVSLVRRPHSAFQQARMEWLMVGLLGGLLPFMALTLLPLELFGQAVLPGETSSLGLVLLPVCVSVAIVRVEFLDITALVRRRTLRLLLQGAWLAGVALLARWLVALGLQQGWPTPVTAASASVLAVLVYIALQPRLNRRIEQLVLHESDDPAELMVRLSATVARAAPQALGPLVVGYLSTMLDLDFALLLTSREHYLRSHPRRPLSVALQDAVVERAQEVVGGPPCAEISAEIAPAVAVLYLPIVYDQRVQAVLCCGPKHSGDVYSHEEISVLTTLVQYLGTLLHMQEMQDHLAEQTTLLQTLQEESTQEVEALTRREVQVLLYVAQGWSNRQIAEHLDRDEGTVEKHIKNLRHKLRVRTSTEAVTVARRKGMLPEGAVEEGEAAGTRSATPGIRQANERRRG